MKPSYNTGIFGIDQATGEQAVSRWITPVTIANNNLYGFAFDVADDANGDGFIVYMSSGTTPSNVSINSIEIQAPTYNLGFLTSSVTVSTGSKNAYPKIAGTLIGSTHNLVALWIDNNGTHNLIQAASGTANAIKSPTNLIVTQGELLLGAFIDYFNQVTWHASASPNISKYLIFRNGTFVTSVPNGTLQYIDHNRFQGEQDTYGIAAVDNTGLQSPVVFISTP